MPLPQRWERGCLVHPRLSPHLGGGAGREGHLSLPEHMEALGDRPPGLPFSSHSPGHINIYLGKAKVDWGGPSGFSLPLGVT